MLMPAYCSALCRQDPTKVESGAVDTILGKFRGNEEQMWMLLQRMFPDEDIAAAKSASES